MYNFEMTRSVRQKILLLLLSGLALGMTRSPKRYFKIVKTIPRAWNEIDRHELYRAVREFHQNRLVNFIEKNDGTTEIVLSERGKRRALRYKFDEMEIKRPLHWDNKWRIVMFDIPEKRKQAREALRSKLRELGFKEFQKSVFIHPFECTDEINFIIEIFGIRPYVRLARSDAITNEAELLLRFKLD